MFGNTADVDLTEAFMQVESIAHTGQRMQVQPGEASRQECWMYVAARKKMST